MKDKHKLIQAVKSLRQHLGLTQPEMATLLDKSLASVVRYETNRVPPVEVVSQLDQIASDKGLSELAAIFDAYVNDRIGSHLRQVAAKNRSKTEILTKAGLAEAARERALESEEEEYYDRARNLSETGFVGALLTLMRSDLSAVDRRVLEVIHFLLEPYQGHIYNGPEDAREYIPWKDFLNWLDLDGQSE